MQVSVIIPAYNSAKTLAETLDSVLAQSHPAAEILVIDDGSTDDTPQLLARYGPPVRTIRQVNARVAAARNRGLTEATCEWVAFLDADDVWHPHKLLRQLAVLECDPTLILLGTQVTAWPTDAWPSVSNSQVREISRAKLLVKNRLVTSSILVRRSALAQVGPFDIALFGPEDYDLWLRLAEVGRVGILEAPLTGYRDAAGSLSKQAHTMYAGLMRIREKLHERGAFQGRPLLARQSAAHFDFTCAWMFHAAGESAEAFRLLTRSLKTWPLPFARDDLPYFLGRLRLLRAARKSRR